MVSDRRRWALLAVLLAIVATAGCGVSETRRPVDLGDAEVAGRTAGETRDPPSPTSAFTPSQLVVSYLQAAVGDPKEALNRVREFFVPKPDWEPSPAITVVRLIGDPSSTRQGSKTQVLVRMQTVGRLNATGSFDPEGDARPRTETFLVVDEGGRNQFRLEKAPVGLMISDTTLERFYAPSPVYFWNRDTERPRLVPDLRYVPLTIALERRINQVVEWQLVGPSPWLEPAVLFQTGVKLKEAVVLRSNGPVVVNLSSAAVSDKPEELRRLADQLRWTVRAHVSGPGVDLQIEGQKLAESIGDGYLAANPAAETRDAALFDIDAESGKVVSRSGPKLPPRVLEAKANASVRYAGISADPYNVAAYVNQDDQLTVAKLGAPDAHVSDLPGPIGRPVWIPESNDQFLVPAGGMLHVINARRRASPITPPGIGRVDAVSVSPDGRRVALAAGGRAYVGALEVGKGSVKVGSQLRELVPGRMSVAAVAWASEARVLVAGWGISGKKAALFRATADGAIAIENSPEEAALTDVTAFPDRTGGPSGASYIVARTADAVFYVFIRETEAGSTVTAAELNLPFYAG